MVGVDFSPVAVEFATASARRLGLESRARFVLADAMATGLPAASLDGAMSTDAIQLMPSPVAVIAEAARILKPGAVFAFTTWCFLKGLKGHAAITDYRPVLKEAGFTVETYDEPADWRRRQRAVFEQIQKRTDAHTHRYDTGGRLIESRLTMMGMEASRRTFAYDEFGNKSVEVSYGEGGAFASKTIFTREYDGHGNWTKEVVSSASSRDAEFGLSTPVHVTRRAFTYYE